MNENLLTNLFQWDDTDLCLIDDSKKSRICGRHLSPTQGASVEGCMASMAAKRLLPFKFDLMAAYELGNVFHYIMENLFDLEPEERTKEAAFELLDEVEANGLGRSGPKYKEAFQDPEVKAAWRTACEININGYFEIEDPTKVRVVATELDLRGIEVGGVPFNGKIDRLDESPSGALLIRDYKTGKYKDDSYGDSHGNQLRLYKAALSVHPEYKDRKVSSAELLYVTAAQKRKVKTAAREVEATVKQFAQEWAKLQEDTASGVFPTDPGILCKWCPLVFACPAAQREGITNIHKGEAVGEPYSPNELGITNRAQPEVVDAEQVPIQMGVGYVPAVPDSEALEYPPSVATQQFTRIAGQPPHQFEANIQAPNFGAFEDGRVVEANVPQNVVPEATCPTNRGNEDIDTGDIMNHQNQQGYAQAQYAQPQAQYQEPAAYTAPQCAPQEAVQAAHQGQNVYGTPPAPEYAPAESQAQYQAPAVPLQVFPEPQVQYEYQVPQQSIPQPEVPHHRPYREGKPWEGPEIDGHANTASTEFGAAMRMTNLALYEVMQAHIKPTGAIITALARTFENILAKAEFQISGSVDTGLKLHAHMRGVLADNLAYFPVPWVADANTWQGWSQALASRIANMVNIAIALTRDPQPSPETPAYAPLVGVMAAPWER